MAEEFEESEVIFQDDEEDTDESSNNCHQSNNTRNNKAAKRKKLKTNNSKNSAAPVSIPENVSRNSWLRCINDQSADHLEGSNDDGEMVPPHIIVRRRVAGKMMAFSVCTGNGRTLKGRDLSRVRNSVLRMTGFLET